MVLYRVKRKDGGVFSGSKDEGRGLHVRALFYTCRYRNRAEARHLRAVYFKAWSNFEAYFVKVLNHVSR
jgi:hypothetical protein